MGISTMENIGETDNEYNLTSLLGNKTNNSDVMKTWQIRKSVRKRWRFVIIKLFILVFIVSSTFSLFLVTYNTNSNSNDQLEKTHQENTIVLHTDKHSLASLPKRRLLQILSTEGVYTHNFTTTSFQNGKVTMQPSTTTISNKVGYLGDLFTLEERRKGAVVFHIMGILYMFIALAVVCDEFFVPSLEVIINKLEISEDVAGATFMAAGGSAPELFTSIFGVFMANSDVGIGTIVGSAVFNILFVIGMCAVFSQGVLVLTWWPLFRDVSFYSISLICLICFFQNKEIIWWEALVLLICYLCYVTFMKFNKTIERIVKTWLGFHCSDGSSNDDQEQQNHTANGNVMTDATSSKFRQGLIHLFLRSMDPMDNSRVHEAPMRLQAMTVQHQQSIAEVQTDIQNDISNHKKSDNKTNGNIKHSNGKSNHDISNNKPLDNSVSIISNGSVRSNGGTKLHTHGIVTDGMRSVMNAITPVCDVSAYNQDHHVSTKHHGNGVSNGLWSLESEYNGVNNRGSISESGARYLANGDRDTSSIANLTVPYGRSRLNTLGTISRQDLPGDEPLDLSWPSTWKKRLLYLFVAPIAIPLWITLPDVRRKSKKKWYPITFIGSILWIGAYAYFMNIWAETTCKTIGIPEAVMGLVFLSAGTSIPDLITSVIVAKKGFGDMAVSSSVGSNIFDVTVGLPLPWLLYNLIFKVPYKVDSNGLLCSVILLFSMLIIVIILIAAFKWKMHKGLGASMFFMYIIFLCLSLLLHYEKIPCPKVV